MATRKRSTPQGSSTSSATESQHPLVQQSHATQAVAAPAAASAAPARAQPVTNSGISIDGVTFPRTTVEVIKRRVQTPRA